MTASEEAEMAFQHELVVVGGSAGALEALRGVLGGLSPGFPASVLVVIHSAAEGPGGLPAVLSRMGPLKATHAVDGEPLVPGRIYVAPRDRHLLVKKGRVVTPRGPKENLFRPAIDPLFRTAARLYGPRVIGVILSGGLDDGTHGLGLVHRHGGLTVVQDPDDAAFDSMPLSAMQFTTADHVVPSSGMGSLLESLARQPAPAPGPGREAAAEGIDIAEAPSNALPKLRLSAPPSPMSCPDCDGALWEQVDNGFPLYRCHVGHGFTARTLAAGQEALAERDLWTALRREEEIAEIYRRMEAVENAEHLAAQHRVHLSAAERNADAIRTILTQQQSSDEAATGRDAGARRAGRPAGGARPRGRRTAK
jgi:two-component system, chemotaxis family, protein-glutamate methylesterase/glutaminase